MQKNDFMENEKVKEVLNTKSYQSDSSNCDLIASKCSICGAKLNSVERLTFFDKCYNCTKYEVAKFRDYFFKKNIIIALVIVVLFIINGIIRANSEALGAIALSICGLIVGGSVFYVFFTNPKLLPDFNNILKIVLTILISLFLAFCATMIVKYSKNFAVMYVHFVILILYFGYMAYLDVKSMNNTYYLLETCKRKMADNNLVAELDKVMKKNDLSNAKTKTTVKNFEEKKDDKAINENKKQNSDNNTKSNADNGNEPIKKDDSNDIENNSNDGDNWVI